ncbi:TonB-dependent receptor [Caulobacter sp. Root487D2Y]|uniref:TonB-dependent receptor n=1 Tax=Caulobacter sp. Root487D2Y TaxID=1736547 RepID=UPI0006FC9892|nr:TonB-dependent receptor [Caulobacter sp. Root487D2Y]KQY35517.1 TonB-dependent receptor [Caulobacter sp. Root487D2Y]
MPRRVLLSAASLLAFALAASPTWAAETPAPTDASAAPEAPDLVDKVVVTAAPYAVSLDTVTSSVNVVTRDQLDVAPPAGIGDMLNGLPGLRSTFYGPGASRPVIRGLSGPRVMVLQNGVGQVDASSLSPDHAVASDPGEASRIEVLRGPSTLAYGGSGIGGVVNMIDDRVPSTPAADGPEGRLSASASSVDDGWAYSGAVKAGKGPIVFAADVSSRRTDDYSIPTAAVSDRLAARDGLTVDPDHVVKNTDVEVDAYGAGVSWVHDRGFIGASVKKTDTTYGVPYEQILAPIDPNAEGPVSIHLQQTRYDLRGEQALDTPWFEKVRVSLGYADYEHAEVSVEDGAVGTRFLSHGTEGRVELVHREHDGHQGAIGFQALDRHFEAIGDEAFVPSTDVKEYGIFTLQRLDRGTWGLDAGLRFDTRSLQTPTQKRDFDNVSASLGVFYKPTDALFTALTLSRNGRAPTEFELFADGPHPGTGGFEVGDDSLDNETVTSLEATVRWKSDRLRAEGHLWAARYDNFIEEAPTGAVQDDLPVYQYFQTKADFHGAELEAAYDAWRGASQSIRLETTFDWVRGDTDAGVPARIPPWSLGGSVVWTAPRVETTLEVRRVAEQDRVAAFETPTDGYTVVNLKATFRPIADSPLRLFVDGRNLTDQEIREHVSFLKDIAPSPGRSVRAGVAWKF